MKLITDHLNWPMTEDIAQVLTNLSREKKLELSVALSQMALEEKQGRDGWDRVEMNLIDSSSTLPIALPASLPIEGAEFEI